MRHGPSRAPGTAWTAEDLGARSTLAHWLSGTLSGDAGSAALPVAAWPAALSMGIQRVCGAAKDASEHESERVRLFVNAPGGIPAPPYGSWWLERRLQGDSSAEVAEYYRREGLRIETGSGSADYLPAELEFIHFLLQHQRAARMTGERRLESQAALREREFLGRFMLPWMSEFRSAVASATADPFWRAVVDLTDAFVYDESERVGAGGSRLGE